MNVDVIRMGCTTYNEALRLQEELHSALCSNGCLPGYILVVEHPPTITLGRRLRIQDIDPERRDLLDSLGIELIESGRGGLATYHGPGQVVVYPILRLRSYNLTVRSYVEFLEQALVSTCRQFHVAAERGCRVGRPIGAWVGSAKVGQLGVAIRHGISLHGVSLNVANDLAYFELIEPCGLPDVAMTSLQREGAGGSRLGIMSSFVGRVADHLVGSMTNLLNERRRANRDRRSAA